MGVQVLKRVAIGVGLATLLVAVVGFILPRSYLVSRSMVIAAEPARIHELVGDLARWPEWSPWTEEVPAAQITFGPETTGIGAHQSWRDDSGTGELTFTRCDPASGVAYDIAFDEGRFRARGEIAYRPVDQGTEVAWSMTGDSGWNILERYMGLMMDGMVGPMFQDGLDRLKVAAERPVATPADARVDSSADSGNGG